MQVETHIKSIKEDYIWKMKTGRTDYCVNWKQRRHEPEEFLLLKLLMTIRESPVTYLAPG
jgi:hypothetical protein